MKRFSCAVFLAVCCALPTAVVAGTADIFVFVNDQPVKDIEVMLNGQSTGVTDDSGFISAEMGDGDQAIVLIKEGKEFSSTEYSVTATQDAEVSFVLYTDEAPVINVAIIGAGTASERAVGFLKGAITDVNGEPIDGAKIAIAGSDLAAYSDASGSYSLTVTRGVYDFEVSHPDFPSTELKDVRIVANIGTAAVVKLQPAGGEAPSEEGAPPSQPRPQVNIALPVEEMVILGHFSGASEDAFTIEQMATTVVDALDLEQIIRMGDSDVAGVVKRVVGVSVVDGKFAVIRGLDGRYIPSELNRVLMPTTNPFKRDAELDLFPAEILGGIDIQKSFSADLPADSTAGTILIKTRDIPDEYSNKLGVSIAYSSEFTGDDGFTLEGPFSSIPQALDDETNGGRQLIICQIAGQQGCVEPERAAELSNLLPNAWNPGVSSISPDYGLSYSLGNVFDMDFGSLAAYGSLSYNESSKEKVDGFIDDTEDRGEFSESAITEKINGYLVVGATLNNGAVLDSKTSFISNSSETVRIFDVVEIDDDTSSFTTQLELKDREYLGQLFSGEHFIFGDHTLDWRIGFSNSTADIPDRRTHEIRGGSIVTSNIERYFLEMEEDAVDFGLDYVLPADISSSWRLEYKAGLLFNEKERTNEVIRIGALRTNPSVSLATDIEEFLSPENFNSGDVQLSPITANSDLYESEQTTTAFYSTVDLHYNDSSTFTLGVRFEEFEQAIFFPNVDEDDENNPLSNETSDPYPVIGYIFRPNETWQFRFSYAETISRPTTTERAPTIFFDDRGRQFIGNPDLLDSEITNFDFRVEYYFLEQGSVSLALFYKDIENPTEIAIPRASGSASSALTWRNEEGADLFGVEFDINKEFINTGDLSAFVSANLALIESEIVLGEQSAADQLLDERELQGQSPALGNLQLGLDLFESQQKFTLLVNYFDDRIDIVQDNPLNVIFEEGRITVDFNYEKAFYNGSSIKVKLQNITDAPIDFTQAPADLSNPDNQLSRELVEGWNVGPKISVGYSYKF